MKAEYKMNTHWRLVLLSLLFVLACISTGIWLFIQSPKFGKHPEGAHLEKIQASPHYSDEVFHNALPTPVLTDGSTPFSALLKSVLTKKTDVTPAEPIPVKKTLLKALNRSKDYIIWLGHSSFFIQLSGQRILIDPVLSDYAAPVPFSTRAFQGSNPYSPEEFPEIDILLISHDHWDHLDYATLTALKPKIRRIICGLGVGAHLQHWGFSEEYIHEGDWGDTLTMGEITVYITPARHYSGRTLTRNKTLWAGFVIETPRHRIFYSGDSGYSPHFAQLGRQFKTFDLALLDCGQYDSRWSLIHMTPEETANAADDLHAKALLPAHAGKFSISYHTWDDPYIRIAAASHDRDWRLITPYIGEAVPLDILIYSKATPHTDSPWWLDIKK